MRSAHSLSRRACDQRPDAVGAHELRAVEQRQPLFRLELEGFPAQFAKHFGRRTHHLADLHLAQTQQRQAHVGQRREVARSAERTLLIDDGQDVAVEQLDETLHRRQLHARMAVGERLYLEQQNQPHDLRGHALPGSAGARHHEVLLQARQLVAAHRNIAQRPETGRDAVDRPLGVLHLASRYSRQRTMRARASSLNASGSRRSRISRTRPTERCSAVIW